MPRADSPASKSNRDTPLIQPMNKLQKAIVNPSPPSRDDVTTINNPTLRRPSGQTPGTNSVTAEH